MSLVFVNRNIRSHSERRKQKLVASSHESTVTVNPVAELLKKLHHPVDEVFHVNTDVFPGDNYPCEVFSTQLVLKTMQHLLQFNSSV